MPPQRAAARLLIRPSTYTCPSCSHTPNISSISRPYTSRPKKNRDLPGVVSVYQRDKKQKSTLAPVAFALLPTRRLISLSGPDATHYLQGVLTANVFSSPVPSKGAPSAEAPVQLLRTSGFYGAFLNAQGRVLNDVFVYPDVSAAGEGEKGWLIEVDANEAEKLAKHIKRYRLRAKFEVRLLDEGERGVWSLWREKNTPEGDLRRQGGGIAASKLNEYGCKDTRAPGMGRRLILPAGKKPPVDAEEVDEGAYRVRRYLLGVPEGQGELIRESALPLESNIDIMGGIDYRKGCYVGQELTIRTHHTGVVRKRILPVMLYNAHDPAPETLQYTDKPEDIASIGADLGVLPAETTIGRVEKRGRSAGKWLAGVGNIGLALCRLEIMTDLKIQGQGENGGYKEGDEFKLEWQVEGGQEEMIKIKAFVPEWHPKSIYSKQE